MKTCSGCGKEIKETSCFWDVLGKFFCGLKCYNLWKETNPQ